jgi:hypothetical protein
VPVRWRVVRGVRQASRVVTAGEVRGSVLACGSPVARACGQAGEAAVGPRGKARERRARPAGKGARADSNEGNEDSGGA